MINDTTSPASAIPAAISPSRRSTLHRLARRRSTLAFAMTLPLILIIGGLVAYPFFYALYLAMQNKRMTRFVWFDNFTFLLSRETFQDVIWQSVIFAVGAVIAKALIGFILAHVLHALPEIGRAHV